MRERVEGIKAGMTVYQVKPSGLLLKYVIAECDGIWAKTKDGFYVSRTYPFFLNYWEARAESMKNSRAFKATLGK